MFAKLLFIIIMSVFVGCVVPPKPFEPIISPPTKDETVADQQPLATIVVDQTGQITIDGRVFTKDENLDELVRLVREKVAANKSDSEEKVPVYIRADKTVKYGYVKRLTDELKKIESIRIALKIDGLTSS